MKDGNALVKISGLKKYFPVTQRGIFQRQIGSIKAVDGISFEIFRGETLGLVGESGCGKTTTGRTIIRLYRPTAGKVSFDDIDMAEMKGKQLRLIRKRMQMIFQDPFSSLNPRLTISRIISEPIVVHKLGKGKQMHQRVEELLALVGLNPLYLNRYPHEFSGGQRQRIAVARSLASNPDFIVCDEPISALDVSIQAQVVNLLEDLQKKFGLTYLFIAHDLSVVRHICDRVAVMYLGKIVELADRNDLYNTPQHPYTQALLSAVPIPDPEKAKTRRRVILKGDPPSPSNPPPGCRFHPRCPLTKTHCKTEMPVWREIKSGHWVACHEV